MFGPSKFPTRILVRCPTCHGEACIDRAIYDTMQVFCSGCNMPVIVVSVTAGALLRERFIEHPIDIATTPKTKNTIAACSCVEAAVC